MTALNERVVGERAAVHEDEVLNLVARAYGGRRFRDLGFSDPVAEQMLAAIDFDGTHFDDRRLRPELAHTMVVDAVVQSFFDRHPEGLAIAVKPGLCSRFWRLDNGLLRWIDVDSSPIADFKASLLSEKSCERHVIAACCSSRCGGWLRCLSEARDVPTIIVGQGAFRRFAPGELDEFLLSTTRNVAPGTELVLDYDASMPLRPSSRQREASLEAPTPGGAYARYPRLRFMPLDAYAPPVAHAMNGMNGLSRLFRGKGIPSVAHLRFV